MQNQPKIYICVNSLALGGTERHLSYVLPELHKRGWLVEVIALFAGGDLANTLQKFGIVVHAPEQPLSPLAAMIRFWKIVRTDPQAILHYFLPKTYLLGGLTAFIMRLPHSQVMSRRSMNWYQKKIPGVRWMESFLHRRMDALLGNSEAVVSQLLEEGAPKECTHLLYNGIDLTSFDASVPNRAQLNIPADAFVMTIVANLIPYKGHTDLLQALGAIKDTLPQPWRLLCIGKDQGIQKDLEARAQQLGIQDNVMWLGSCDPTPYLKNSDVGLLCSHEEGFSNAILEGMAVNLPMIVTDVGGNKEAVLSRVTGLVVPPHDLEALSNAILMLAQHPEMREKFAQAGRARVEQVFNLQTCVDHYETLYNNLGS